MGTKEAQNNVEVPVAATTAATAAATNNTTTTHNNNANTTTTAAAASRARAASTLQQQQQHQQQQRVIIPATQASTVATNAAKKIRRAFSMPRNPFRWSRKFKTTAAGGIGCSAGGSDSGGGGGNRNSAISSCVGGGRGRSGSIVSLSSYEAVVVCKNSNGGEGDDGGGSGGGGQSNTNESSQRKANGVKHAGGGGGGGGGGEGSNRVLRRSSFRKFLNRIAQHVSSSVNVGSTSDKSTFPGIVPFYASCWRRKEANKHASSQAYSLSTLDRVPPIGGYQWPADQTPGVMGLKNHGNTCFMNAVLQCLSHTDILAEYFVLDQYKADLKRRNKINSRKFGTKGELTEQLANVLKALWTCKNESDHSTTFKAVVDRYGSQFRSSTQHDAQEFLFWLLDKVHEDLNTATKRRYKSVKNTYGRPDEVIAAETLANHIRCNNSFVQAVFQAQFRSSLTCPRCRKQSNTFDPFHCISVQLPQLMQQTIYVTVVYLKQRPQQVKLGLTVPAGSPIVALREQLQTDTGIASDCIVLADIGSEGFARVFYDTQPVSTLNGIETIYCIEVPAVRAAATASTTTSVLPAAVTATAETAASTAAAAKSTTSKTSGTAEEAPKGATASSQTPDLLLLVANVRKRKRSPLAKADEEVEGEETAANGVTNDATATANILERFGAPFSLQVPRDCSYAELQKKLLREMSPLLKPEVFADATPLANMFQIRLQDPSADPDTFLEQVEHPLLTEMIDLALSVLSAEAGPPHIKLLLEWAEPEQHFADLSDNVVEHESVARLAATSKANDTAALSLEQCLEHYTKAETLSAEDAWRCPHCQQYLPVVKTLGLWSLPDILVVHFKRFRQHQEKGSNAAKLTTMVKFPLYAFDMAPHLARGVAGDEDTTTTNELHRPSPWKRNAAGRNDNKSVGGGGDSRSSTLNSCDSNARRPETRYDLYAVCYHQGDTLETGHYTAACKNPYDRQWYKFDDQRVGKVPADDIQAQIINNEAYMLFYQKRGGAGDVVECSASSSNSGGEHWVSRIAPPPAVVEKLAEQSATTEALLVSSSASAVATSKLESTATPAVPEKSETKPVEIPKVHLDAKEAASAIVAPMDSTTTPSSLLAQMVVNKSKTLLTDDTELVNIAELDFADADDEDDDELQALEQLANNKSAALADLAKDADEDDANQIFVMDEDCQINDDDVDNNAEIHTNKEKSEKDATKTLQTKTEAATVATTTTPVALKTKSSSPILTDAAATTAAIIPTAKKVSSNLFTATAASGAAATNGYDSRRHSKPPSDGSISPHDIKSHSASNTSSSASSTASSLSSSPQSLAVSVHASSTLQSKFNGFSASSSSANNYKESSMSTPLPLLSSSLKSNSSSIIGAVAAASAAATSSSHEFALSRHHNLLQQQQNQHWNGSRSSVSAVESVQQSQQQQQHATHCLNLRHSFSTSSNYKLRECSETLSSMLRNSANTCSKDTLIFIDQQNHHHHRGHHHHNHHSLMEDDDDTFMGSRSLWISPVTPHKLITVSPKN